MRRKNDGLIVGLDIGTTKICAVVGEETDDGIEIVGIGQHRSTGLRKGVVINIEATIASIAKAIEEAELMAGCEITDVHAGIAGSHINGFNSKGVIAVQEKEVSQDHVRRVIEQAKAVVIPKDQEIIHVLPQDYIIDEQDGIREPKGMAGVRLEVRAHVVTAAQSALQNIVKCANRAGLRVSDIALEPIASSKAVLSPDEQELGVAMADIGGGTTDLAIFVNGSIVHTAVLPVGGNHFTNDIAWGLKTPFDAAEEIKLRHGCALADLIEKDETIAVPSTGGRPPRTMERSLLTQIIEARADELIQCIEHEILKSGYSDLLAAGMVLTGGTGGLAGLAERTERSLDMQVRRGPPTGVGGLTDVVSSPTYATGVGLVLHGAELINGSGIIGLQKTRRSGMGSGTPAGYTKFKERVRTFVGEFF